MVNERILRNDLRTPGHVAGDVLRDAGGNDFLPKDSAAAVWAGRETAAWSQLGKKLLPA
jgi:hypothetical protein